MSASGVIHVIDDDDAMRDSLRFLLASAGFQVRDHNSAGAFLDQAITPGQEIACVVSDIRMPETDGIELLRRLQVTRPEIPVILLTGHGDISLAVEAMKLGAADFLEKPFDDTALLGAVEQALARKGDKAGPGPELAAISARIEQLSPRERDVLSGLVAGKQNKTIARELDISPRTVEVYRANLMTKMQASNLSLLVRMALIAEFPERWTDTGS